MVISLCRDYKGECQPLLFPFIVQSSVLLRRPSKYMGRSLKFRELPTLKTGTGIP